VPRPGRRGGTRYGRGQVGLGDDGISDVVAGELAHDMAAREDEDAIAQALELDAVRGCDDDRHALLGQRAQALIDLGAGADSTPVVGSSTRSTTGRAEISRPNSTFC